LIVDERGDWNLAVMLLQQALERYLKLGDRRSVALTLANLGDSLRILGDLPRASAMLEDSLEHFKEIGDREGMALALNNLGDLECDLGNLNRAASRYRDGLRFAREVGAKRALLNHMEGAAVLAYHLGLPDQAARLLSFAAEMRETAQISRSLGNQASFDSHLALVQSRLVEAAFAAEWEVGHAMSLAEAEAMVAALDQFASTQSGSPD
jgi:tetratricopeptide (TPR) repeat protein